MSSTGNVKHKLNTNESFTKIMNPVMGLVTIMGTCCGAKSLTNIEKIFAANETLLGIGKNVLCPKMVTACTLNNKKKPVKTNRRITQSRIARINIVISCKTIGIVKDL